MDYVLWISIRFLLLWVHYPIDVYERQEDCVEAATNVTYNFVTEHPNEKPGDRWIIYCTPRAKV